MCGIFAYIGDTTVVKRNVITKKFKLGSSRGPESSKYSVFENVELGFHRLAINGIDSISNQPFNIYGIYLVCNGEIYNYRELYSKTGITPTTNSDCEVIIYLYLKYGIDYLLDSLDGVFSFVLYDSRNGSVYVARDPYGVRPLYYLQTKNVVLFASELKQLASIPQISKQPKQFPPGSVMNINIYNNNKILPSFCDFSIESVLIKTELRKYSSFGFSNIPELPEIIDSNEYLDSIYYRIYTLLFNAVKKRVIGTTDRKVACLLSGGLDSSTIAAMVNSFLPRGELETYSIGLPGATDLVYARMVANHLGTNHTEIILTEEEFFNSIPEVIGIIESYDTTTVRASVGNYLIGKYIRDNSTAKVIFNGDGSDELTGGYKYFNLTKDPLEFDNESRRLLRNIYNFDVLRSDKSISSNGLEPRTPFLDRTFVQYYLSIKPEIRCHSMNGNCEKFLLRTAISKFGNFLLPNEVLWRQKEAFSDGVSPIDRSWFEVIKEHVSSIDDLESFKPSQQHLIPKTLEMKYYRKIFDSLFPGCAEIVPYLWMPKYSSASDPSARTL